MTPSSEVLFSSDLWEPALEKFATAAHLTVKLFDNQLRAIGGPIHPTPLFQLFDETGYDPGIFVKCVAQCLAQTRDRPAVIVSQFHGLAVVGTSLILEGIIVGAAVGGYILADFSQVSEIQSLARQAGIAFDRLWDVARQQQPVPQNRLIVHGELLQVLGDALLRENYRTRQFAETAAIVASSDDAIVGKDLNGVITSWNRGAERIFGYTAREAVGQSITMLIPADHMEDEPMILGRIRRGDTVDHYETVRQRKDGTLLDISLTVSPIKDANSRVVGASKIARDITERKRAEEILRLSQTQLEAELADTKLLHAISSQLVQEENVESLYEKVLDSAVSIMRSDFASLQMLFPERGTGGELRLLAFRGFSPQAAAFWKRVGFDSGSTCGAALRTGKRVIATDVEKCDFMKGTKDQAVYLHAGIHAVQTTPLLSRNGKVVGMISTHWRKPHEPSERDLRVFDILARQAADLVERNTAQEAVRKSEEHYRILFDLGPVAIYSCDASGVIQEFNRRATELWGRTPALGDTDERFFGPFKLYRPDGSFMPHEQCPMAEVLSGKIAEARDTEVLIHRPDGTHATVIVNIRPLKDQRGEVGGAINCFYDISQRKQSEEALQHAHDELETLVEKRTASLRRLSSHLQRVQDDERRKIARELHDSAGQYLAAVKMNLAPLHEAELSKAEASALAESEHLVDRCLAEIRTISHLLHPPLLDESGLSSAATWYAQGFEKRSGIKVELNISSIEKRLPETVEMALFRALQESLTNVHRHSGSSKVDIRIEVANGEAALIVRDYGRGFPMDQLAGFEKGVAFGVGLVGMRERVNELNGKFKILSETPGTSVIVIIPTKPKQMGTIPSMKPSDERGSAA